MKEYITPNDPEVIGASDSESIQNAVDLAVRTDVLRVRIPRINARTGAARWDIDRAVILESGLEIVLDNCLLRQADGCFDNVFRSFGEEPCYTMEGRKHDIRIVGEGHAVIDGGLPNGLTESTWRAAGLPHVSCNNMILLHNVKGFVIENLTLTNQRWWAVNLVYAESGRISNVHIHCECDLPNQDGIDLRVGCRDIILENLTGTSGDDFIALSAIGDGMGGRPPVQGLPQDIRDITIRNIIATSAGCAVIALRNSDGRQIRNVSIDNVHDVDNGAEESGKVFPDYPKNKINMDIRRNLRGNSPYTLLRIGQDGYYKKRNGILGEMADITATNLYARGGCAVMVNVSLQNAYFGNIHAENDVDYILTTRSGRNRQVWGADLKNVVIENVFYNNTDNNFATAFDFELNGTPRRVEDVIIRRAFLGNCRKPFNLHQEGNVIFSELCGTYVEQRCGELTYRAEQAR